ncbi:MAG: hypothetical protein ACHQ0Y_00185 [Thermodesulfovibrionales bacterium]
MLDLNIVKKCSIRIGVLSIAFSLMFLVVPSGTKAEMQDGAKKDLVSVLHFEDAGFFWLKGFSGERKDRDINPQRTISVPLKEGLNAFLNFTSPPHQVLTSRDSRTDYRAVVGFHFRLR